MAVDSNDNIDKPLNTDTILDILSADDDKDDKKEPEKDKLDLDSVDKDDQDEDVVQNEEENQDDDEDEEEEDKEDKSYEEDEELELSKIPRRQEIKSKYPNFFKDFPAVEHMMYREQQYAEQFPTIASAKEAKERLNDLQGFESEMMSGNIETTLRSIQKGSPDAFKKIADGIYETLIKVDKSSGFNTANKIIKANLKYIHDTAAKGLSKDPENEYFGQLKIATQLLHRAMYDSTEVTGPELAESENKADPEKEKFDKERQQFEQNKFQSAFDEVSTRIDSVLNKAITEKIDEKNALSPYIKKNLVKDVMDELNKQLNSDKRFKDHIDRLWIAARNNNYDSDSKMRLRKALLSKAQSVLTPIMRAKKTEALRGQGSSSKRKPVEEVETPNKNSGDRGDRKITSIRRDNRPQMKDGESATDFMLRD